MQRNEIFVDILERLGMFECSYLRLWAQFVGTPAHIYKHTYVQCSRSCKYIVGGPDLWAGVSSVVAVFLILCCRVRGLSRCNMLNSRRGSQEAHKEFHVENVGDVSGNFFPLAFIYVLYSKRSLFKRDISSGS